MLSCGALERSNSPYKESIAEPCGFDWEGNPEKGDAMEKSTHELQKGEFEYLCVRKK